MSNKTGADECSPVSTAPHGNSNTDVKAPSRRGRKRREFTPTQVALLRYISGETQRHGGVCCSKQGLADLLGCNIKTVDRNVADLRKRGLVTVEPRFGENGGQISSQYRARPIQIPTT